MGRAYGTDRDEALCCRIVDVLSDLIPRTAAEIREAANLGKGKSIDSQLLSLTLQPEPIHFDGESFVIAEEDDGRIFLVPTGGNNADSC